MAHWPHIPDDGIAAVERVLRSGKISYWTGTQARDFEKEFAAYTGAAHAVAVANGTLTLEIALRSLGIGPGDEVIVPSRTFIATAGSVVALGAVPVICDIDPDTNCLTALTVARVTTPRTRAVIVVHLGGYPAPMPELLDFTRQLDIAVIEDCAQAHGALSAGRAVGTWGDAGCYSFSQEKILPLGEGGMITYGRADETDATTRDRARAHFEAAWSYRDHGRSWQKAHDASVAAASPTFRYLNDSFGTNARMGEMEGALGRVLLRHLPAWHAARAANAQVLVDALAGEQDLCRLLVLPQHERERGSEHAYYRLYGLLNIARLRDDWSRDRIVNELNARVSERHPQATPAAQYGSAAFIGREAAWVANGLAANQDLPGAQVADGGSIAFYIDPAHSTDDMQAIADTLVEILHAARV
ncbi:MAG: DegT/DnrJ/EryC1/StrS family aminotransferase [Actinomycetes bacterium]|jgi:dTDP-4-amino-4,6-dideoxygalactose transaminase|nr:DegT/DnrJ/EryC1/StrS family aminotransferase [Actinomycetes bacterium]